MDEELTKAASAQTRGWQELMALRPKMARSKAR
jgi:hypothetical protein